MQTTHKQSWQQRSHVEWEGLRLERHEPCAHDERAHFGCMLGFLSVALFVGRKLSESVVQVRIVMAPADDVLIFQGVGEPEAMLRLAARDVATVREALAEVGK